MKKWIKNREITGDDTNYSQGSRDSFVQNQLRKIIGELEKEDSTDQEVWRTYYSKRHYFKFPKFSYL